jgi:hypothetical protein
MIFFKILLMVSLQVSVIFAFGQMGDTSTHRDTQIIPQHRYDEELPDDLPPENYLKRVQPFQLPADVRKTLNRDEIFSGWHNSRIFYNVNTELYIFYIPYGQNVRIYEMDKRGKVMHMEVTDD